MGRRSFEIEKQRLGLDREKSWFLNYEVFRSLVLGNEQRPGCNHIDNVLRTADVVHQKDPDDVFHEMLNKMANFPDAKPIMFVSPDAVERVAQLAEFVLREKANELMAERN